MNYKKAGKSVKNEARKRSVYGPFGGAAGIRTLVSFQTNGFQERLVQLSGCYRLRPFCSQFISRRVSDIKAYGEALNTKRHKVHTVRLKVLFALRSKSACQIARNQASKLRIFTDERVNFQKEFEP